VVKGEASMRRDWFLGLGAVSTLAMLVGIDLLLTSGVVVRRLRGRR